MPVNAPGRLRTNESRASDLLTLAMPQVSVTLPEPAASAIDAADFSEMIAEALRRGEAG